ncbi:hypothetical protein ACIQ9Q_33975 [Streptomyces sp. NPDC094438]|uniref:hypothetical protein n=1 Tax=Streptomyces sp. NPDC094438 TaxID=3366061 RepID=UPI0037F2578E
MARVEVGDPADSVEPYLEAAVAASEHHLVHTVVDDVSGYVETDRGHVDEGTAVRVGVAGLDRVHNLALQPEPF